MKNSAVILCCIIALIITSSLASANTSLSYDWLSEGKRTGGLKVKVDENKSRFVEFEYQDEGGHRKIIESYKVNDVGALTDYQVSGHYYRGNTVKESFSVKNDVATWHNSAESGSETFNNAYYLPYNGTSFHWAELVSLTTKQKNSKQTLLPVGSLSTVKVLTKTLSHADKTMHVSLVKVLGRSFEPFFIWLDDSGTLFADIYSYGALIASGWES